MGSGGMMRTNGATSFVNLNDLRIETDGAYEIDPPVGSIRSDSAVITAHFRDIDTALEAYISQAQVVVGCVAWLTSEPILKTLSRVPGGVSIVVQKEDFLRPDSELASRWSLKLRDLYDALPDIGGRYWLSGLAGSLSFAGDPMVQPVRCVGNHNSQKAPAFPRMHNKFLVFCNRTIGDMEDAPVPYAVWTGSYNMTVNAGRSFENAVYIEDKSVAAAYYEQWEHIFALSEPLDWYSAWCEPEWRVGT